MAYRPPLHVHLLAHPGSEHANGVAEALMDRFVEPPASGGLRVPVFFTPDRGDGLPPSLDAPDGLNLDAAEHTIVAVLADARMARVAPSGTGVQWRNFIAEAIARAPVGASPHHVLPVALQPKAFELSGQRHFLPAMLEADDSGELRQRRLAEISLHIAARAIQLLTDGKIPDLTPKQIRAPVRLFISHAKADLSADKSDPAYQTMKALADLPVEHWFDAADIVTSQEFEQEISAGLRDSTIMLAFYTDHYGSRPWCRREVLDAKKLGAHLLLVDALQDSEPRHFPYLGNVPSVRWQFGDPEVEARRVVNRAVLEALRFKHNRAQLEAIAEDDEIVLATAPEALTVAFRYAEGAGEKVFLYPDPPLGREELEIVNWVRPDCRFVTPLTKAARRERPLRVDSIAVSVSASNDSRVYGLSLAHQQTLSDEIHLYLLLAGLRIAYGGAVSGDFGAASNFTLRLFELVRGYARLAQSIEVGKFHPIVNYAPWPLRLQYGDREWDLFGKEAEYVEGVRPELPWSDDELFPPPETGWRLAPDTPEKRYAWARGLSGMREQITRASASRLVVGGHLRLFQGLVPGVVEEAWMALRDKRPLYLVGAFGGAARAVSDMLTGVERVEFDSGDAERHVPDYDAAVACFETHGGQFRSMAAIGDDLRALCHGGLAGALHNGLDEAQNLELFRCTDPRRIAVLVLEGLCNLPEVPPA